MNTVLLVEDELLVRELASEDLADAGFEVTTASDGEEAINFLEEGRTFDLLFTDIRMPGIIDGWQLAEKAKVVIPGLRVIYATGLNEAADRLDPNERYVRKPYSLNDLRRALAGLGFEDRSSD
jgi:CheY-like chemotaxis protein